MEWYKEHLNSVVCSQNNCCAAKFSCHVEKSKSMKISKKTYLHSAGPNQYKTFSDFWPHSSFRFFLFLYVLLSLQSVPKNEPILNLNMSDSWECKPRYGFCIFLIFPILQQYLMSSYLLLDNTLIRKQQTKIKVLLFALTLGNWYSLYINTLCVQKAHLDPRNTGNNQTHINAQSKNHALKLTFNFWGLGYDKKGKHFYLYEFFGYPVFFSSKLFHIFQGHSVFP